jgi:hypothetical protein
MQFVNRTLDKGGVRDLISEIYDTQGLKETTRIADSVKEIGFRYATQSGSTLAVSDITVPPEKKEYIEEALIAVEEIQKAYNRGLSSELEQNNNIIQVWQDTTNKVGQAVRKHLDPSGNLSTMALSGATKGGFSRFHRWLVCAVWLLTHLVVLFRCLSVPTSVKDFLRWNTSFPPTYPKRSGRYGSAYGRSWLSDPPFGGRCPRYHYQ